MLDLFQERISSTAENETIHLHYAEIIKFYVDNVICNRSVVSKLRYEFLCVFCHETS